MPQTFKQPYSEFRPDEYIYAKSKEEVISILKQHGESAKIVGAGITLHEMAVLGFLPHVKKLIDLRNLKLEYVRVEGGQVKIGASTKLRDMASNDLFRKDPTFQAVSDAVDSIPLQVANAATLGGNLCSAVPILSMPPVLMIFDSQLVLTGPQGDRLVPIDGFYEDYLLTSLHPDEFLSEVRIPLKQVGGGKRASIYLAEKVVAVDYPTLSIATSLSISKDSKFEEIRVAVGSAGRVPARLVNTEKALQGKKYEPGTVDKACDVASKEIDPSEDLRASPEYRRTLVKYLLKQALGNSVKRTGGSS
jgi:aerobic carbon-monoxide dehydrogenase medium subunit